MHETIPLQILDPFTELFEVGHTSPPTVQMPRSSYGLTSALSPKTGNRGYDDPSSSVSLPRLITMAGIGARRSAFPVGKPHTAMRGAFALCDSPHGGNEGLPLHQATAMANNEQRTCDHFD